MLSFIIGFCCGGIIIGAVVAWLMAVANQLAREKRLADELKRQLKAHPLPVRI